MSDKWFNLIDDNTGRLVSVSSVPVDAKPGYRVVETATRDGVWSEQTREYHPYPEHHVYLTKREYMNRFTSDEWTAICIAKKSDAWLDASFIRLSLVERVKINGNRTRAVLEQLAENGILTEARVQEIINV